MRALKSLKASCIIIDGHQRDHPVDLELYPSKLMLPFNASLSEQTGAILRLQFLAISSC
jgi:hypothetical protein